MNLFRSEEHARRWPGYDPKAAEGTLPLELRQGLFRALRALGKSGPFWGIAS